MGLRLRGGQLFAGRLVRVVSVRRVPLGRGLLAGDLVLHLLLRGRLVLVHVLVRLPQRLRVRRLTEVMTVRDDGRRAEVPAARAGGTRAWSLAVRAQGLVGPFRLEGTGAHNRGRDSVLER